MIRHAIYALISPVAATQTILKYEMYYSWEWSIPQD